MQQEFVDLVSRVPTLAPELRSQLEAVPVTGDSYQTYHPAP
jgi:hypothetical protein